MTRVAQEPAPTESTRMLGQVTHPTTIRPAQTIAPPPRPPAQRPAVARGPHIHSSSR